VRTAFVVCALLGVAGVGAAPRAGWAQTIRDDKEQTERPEVREVRFEGVRALERDSLQEAIATKASACLGLVFTPFCWVTKSPYVYERRYLDRTELARDVVRLLVYYYRRGWRDAAVDTAVTPAGDDAVRVTFRVTEGQPTVVRSIAVDDPLLRPEERRRPRTERRIVRPRPGEPLDLDRLDSTIVDLRGAYWERGYGDVQVARPAVAVDSSTPIDSADVRIAVARGPLTPIAGIEIVRVGERREVSDETIRNSLLIEPGDLFVRSRIARSQRALYESGLFRSALIDTATARDAATGNTVCAQQSSVGVTGRGVAEARAAAAAAPDSAKTLVICVVEGPKREARVSGGFSTADFGQVEGRYTHNYWLGGARVFDVSGAVGNLGAEQLFETFPFNYANGFNQGDAAEEALRQSGRFFAPTYQAGVDVRQRWFGSPRNTLGAGVFVHRRSSPGVFVDRGQGTNLSFTRALTQEIPASATYRFEVSRVEAGEVYFCVNFGVCDDPTINALRGQQRLSPVALTASINRADDPLFPSRGVLARFEAEHASGATLSDFRYNRITAEASTYRRIAFRRSILALRVRGGWVDALPGTNAAVGVIGRAAQDADGEVLHPRKRFYAGGAQSVRGFGENQLGPRVLTVAPDDIRGVEGVTVGPDGSPVTTFTCPPPTDLPTCFERRRNDIPDDRFIARPLGGTTLVEGNVELRFPVWRQLWGAAFLDGAVLGERTLRDLGNGTAALTPGFGVRYLSPVGPVRVDLGYRPPEAIRLPVVTQVEDSTGRRLLNLGTARSCPSTARPGDGCREPITASTSWLRRTLNRITLHLSIGEAF
jgi:outer membrane protein insertion porin family/translocation and assembly module TamA